MDPIYRLPKIPETPSRPHDTTVAPPDSQPAGRFASVLQQVASRLDEGERLVDRAAQMGRGTDADRLLALQAGIYRYTETVELASKLVERSSSAIRTVLQGQ